MNTGLILSSLLSLMLALATSSGNADGGKKAQNEVKVVQQQVETRLSELQQSVH